MCSRFRPGSPDFGDHLTWFLQEIPSVACPKGGRAAYEDAVRFKMTAPSPASNASEMETKVTSSR